MDDVWSGRSDQVPPRSCDPPWPVKQALQEGHTHASLQLAAATPVHVVSRRLGHASTVMTLNVYTHVLNGQHEDAVTRLEQYMEGAKASL